MDKVDITIIGAGVVGLAVAARVARVGRSVLVVERHAKFGQETSSRNSEVIHSGIYYPPGSLKARLCVRGTKLLYYYCARKGVRHAKTGKFIVAADPEEVERLEAMRANGTANGVEGLSLLSRDELKRQEPLVKAAAALFSPETGIVDTHGLMHRLLLDAEEKGAIVAFSTEVTGLKKISNGYSVQVKDDQYAFETAAVVNCAGLSSDSIARAAGIDIDAAGYRLHYCKGDYFRTSRSFAVRHLIYPVPPVEAHGLGIHLTLDLAGSLRFGPDTEYVTNLDYAIDPDKKEKFAAAIRRYLPDLSAEDLFADTAGIRPKLQGPQDDFRDFVIQDEGGRGLPGLINLIGIESPGLTSALAIGEYVEGLIFF